MTYYDLYVLYILLEIVPNVAFLNNVILLGLAHLNFKLFQNYPFNVQFTVIQCMDLYELYFVYIPAATASSILNT